MSVGLIGLGIVGSELLKVFPDSLKYDPFQGETNEETFNADYIFVAVPTPLKDGKLDCSILDEVLPKCSKESIIIIRSAVNPGFCDTYDKLGWNLVYQVEYLGETANHPLLDETNSKFIIIGGQPKNRRKVIDLYMTVYNANVKIRQLTNYEAEIVKLSENRAIAFKVMQCQELYDACQIYDVDYYTIREAVYGDDPRFDLWWTAILTKRGFNSSKCLIKDVPAWSYWAHSGGANTDITEMLIKRSNDYALNSHTVEK